MPRLISLCCLYCLLPGLASAGTVHRCIDRAGHVSYQAASCTTGQRTDRIIRYSDPPAASTGVAAPTAIGKRTASNNSPHQHQKPAISRKPRPSPCARAKAKREAQLRRLGLKRTFDDLSRIDSAVRSVCNGY